MAGMASYRLTTFLTLPLVAASLAFAACGGGDPNAAASDDDRRDELREAGLKFAQCMREHGVDMEDPSPGGGILLKAGPDTNNNPAKMDAAEEACQKYLEDVKPPELSEEDQREFRQRALAFARCMREQGIDMPDPTFGGEGQIQQRLPQGQNPESPRFQQAQEECSKYAPKMMGRREAP
jgi:hypothetical protein